VSFVYWSRFLGNLKQKINGETKKGSRYQEKNRHGYFISAPAGQRVLFKMINSGGGKKAPDGGKDYKNG